MSEKRLWLVERTAKSGLLCAAVYLFMAVCAWADTIPDPIGIGKRTETLGIIGILAAVIVLLVIANVILFRAKEALTAAAINQFSAVVTAATAKIAEDSEVKRNVCAVMVEVKDAIQECKKWGLK
jgi:hypothetical protein